MGLVSEITQLLRIYWALLLGNILEWYEFAIYGYLETYMEENFFQGSALATWLGFAATFVARPLGGAFLGALGDSLGRKAAVMVSILGMLIGTVGQGCLPTYLNTENGVIRSIGVGLLVCLRILQGLCTGGEISAVSTYIVEVGSKEYLARSSALISITCNVGFLLARGVVYLVTILVGPSNMQQWGWRIPFLFALLPGIVAVLGRRQLPESEAFMHRTDVNEDSSSSDSGDAAQVSKLPAMPEFTVLIRSHGYSILVGIGGVISYAVLQYGALVWGSSYLKKHGADSNAVLRAGLCLRGLQILLAFPVGWLGDVKGVAWVTCLGGLCVAATGIPLFAALTALAHDPVALFVVYGLCYGLVGSISGTLFFMYVVELFPTRLRNTGVGISYNIGFCIFGGFAPFMSQASLELSKYGPGILHSLGGLITLLTVLWSLRLQRKGLMCPAHIRPVPYFQCSASTSGLQNDDKQQEEQTDDSQTEDDLPENSDI